VLFGNPTISYFHLFTNSHIILILLLTLPTLPCNALVVNVGSNPNGVCFSTCHSMAMDAQPAKTHPNKNRPPPPLLQPVLVFPPSSQSHKASKKPWSKRKPTKLRTTLTTYMGWHVGPTIWWQMKRCRMWRLNKTAWNHHTSSYSNYIYGMPCS
jgi:hypothetical protein